jgi:hypothetical protein
MKLEKFKEVLDTIRKTDNDIETLRKLGIDIIDTELCKSYWALQALAFTEAYGEDGWDWISWALYDAPRLLEKSKKSGNEEKEYFAWEKDGTPIDLSTDEKLWEYVEKNYNQRE